MLVWAFVFFVLTLVSGLFAFGGTLSGVMAAIADFLFCLCLVVFALSFITGIVGIGRRRT